MKHLKKLVSNHMTVFVLAALAAGVLCAIVALYVLFVNLGSIVGFFSFLISVLTPIIIGLVLAYIIDPVAKFFENKVFRKIKKEKVKRALSAVIALVIVLGLVSVFLSFLIPSLISSITTLIANADTYYASAEEFVGKVNDLGFFGLHIDLSAIMESIKNTMTDFFSNLTKNYEAVIDTTKNIGNSVINILIGAILAVYFLFGKQRLVTGVNHLRSALYTPKKLERSNLFWNRCHYIFTQYIGCNIIDALIIGVSNAIFMLILGMPYVPLVSFVVGLTNLIPTFGPIIGGAIGALILVLIKPSYALWFLIFTVGIQTLDAYVIKPRLFSSSFGIPAVWTLISITIGGKLFGIIGVLLAIPVAAVISLLYSERFIPWLKRKSEARAKRSKTDDEDDDDADDETPDNETTVSEDSSV